ncbi:P-loop containing nucleoside triphosphate hydrolase protein [Zopfochytrium polystomum]|nr:P-loop containing nucleoside triphosphate hydrolase protein [Zopfochytrium polystomum]
MPTAAAANRIRSSRSSSSHDDSDNAGDAAVAAGPRQNQNQRHQQQLQRDGDGEQQTSPEANASFWSLWAMSWYTNLLRTGWKTPIAESDLFPILPERRADPLANQFERLWDEEAARIARSRFEPAPAPRATRRSAFFWDATAFQKKKPSTAAAAAAAPSVLWICARIFWRLPLWGFVKIVSDACLACSSLLLKGLVQFLVSSQQAQQDPPDYRTGYYYAVGLLVLNVVASLFTANVAQRGAIYGAAVKGQLTAAIYRKALRLSGLSRSRFNPGMILNMVSTDLGRIELAFMQLNIAWPFPFWFTLTAALLFRIIGIAGLAGLALMVLCVPLQGFMIGRLMRIRKRAAGIADERIKLTTEILQGIRIIKFFTWENNFVARVADHRDAELRLVKNAAFIRAVISSLGFAIPAISSAVTFLVYGALNPTLSPVQIFAALALFNQLRQPVMWLPLMIANIGDAMIAFDRLQAFFEAPEVQFRPRVEPAAKFGVEVRNGEFVWESSMPEDDAKDGAKAAKRKMPLKRSIDSEDLLFKKPTIRNVNLKAPLGGLTAVVGAVGSGKSSLISALIGEMRCNSGEVIFASNVGYCTQQAWIVNASVRDNILFGRPFDPARYAKVVDACCLKADFAILPQGDQSEIGERGINLSGGQKQRVSLARLMYTDCDIALLDDPLSAVDANVGKKIFESGICGILAKKTRIFVTHQLHLVSRCDWVIVISDGTIAEQGTFQELMRDGHEFSRLMVAYGGENAHTSDDEENEAGPFIGELAHNPTSIPVEDSAVVPARRPSKVDDAFLASHSPSADKILASRRKSTSSTSSVSSRRASKERDGTDHLGGVDIKGFTQTKAEGMERGNIKAAVLWSYIRNVGTTLFVVLTVVGLVSTQVTRLANDLWLVSWTQSSYSYLTQGEYMGIYAVLGIAQASALLIYSLQISAGGVKAAENLHNKVLKSAINSPVGFFDQTPLGRIVNRLSRDVDYADNSIYDAMRLLFYSGLQLSVTFGLVTYLTKGAFLVPLVPMLALYYYTQLFYRATSRDVKRFESITRSPLYAHISESMTGLPTIRAYSEQARFVRRCEDLIDRNASPLYLLYTGQKWLQLRLEMLGNFLMFSVALYSAADRSGTNPSQIGLALSYLLQTTALLNMVVSQAVEAEVQLNAIERLVEYVELPPEELPGAPLQTPPANWPQTGSIEFADAKMRYQPQLPLVLKGINLSIQGGEKIGIVGRTGSGKSSIMQALFRIVNLAAGSISIDGVDINRISLHTLRSHLAIIPQDPVLFSGSLRTNLDPNSRYTDDFIWSVLDRCGMKDAVATMDGKLDAVVVENGENMSVGQRQLLCLARAVLLKPKIIVLDECTASVDMENDALIQRTIKNEFSTATTLTIAHRLNTIIDSDKILLLHDGVVKEFDSPYALLVGNPDSEFSKLVAETGEANAQLLRNTAAGGWSLPAQDVA